MLCLYSPQLGVMQGVMESIVLTFSIRIIAPYTYTRAQASLIDIS